MVVVVVAVVVDVVEVQVPHIKGHTLLVVALHGILSSQNQMVSDVHQ